MPDDAAILPFDPAPAPADFRREVVVGGDAVYAPGGGLLVAQFHDEVLARFGPLIYELMACEPAVSSALGILVSGVMGDGPAITPAVRRRAAEAIDPAQANPDADPAEAIARFNERGLARLDRPLEETVEDWLTDALIHGSSVMEQTYEYVESGPDAGRLMLRTLAVKPRWAWEYRVDPAMRVEALRCRTIAGDSRDVRRAKFAILTLGGRYRDPRGRSALRPAYNAWNRKVQRWGGFEQYLQHFADPSLILKAGEKVRDQRDPLTGRVLSPAQQMVEIGKLFRNQAVVGLPDGADAEFVESKGDGQAYHLAFDRDDREMYSAILYAPRAVTEAQHGSKADTSQAMDVLQMRIKRVRRPTFRAFRDDVLYLQTSLNYGKDAADRLTPEFAVPSDDRATPDMLNAFANAYAKGIVVYEQLPYLWDRLDLPAPPGGLPPKPEPVAPAPPNADPNANAAPAGGANP